jgi:hypothetical protein
MELITPVFGLHGVTASNGKGISFGALSLANVRGAKYPH